MNKLVKADKPAKVHLFSETLDEPLARTVRQIAGRTERFATAFIGVANDDGPALAVRLEARLNPTANTWSIDRYTHAPALGETSKDTEAHDGLCFFDALSHCARFERTELAGHEGRRIIEVPGEHWAVTHFREAAENAGQIIDRDGVVQPCAFGRPLLNGAFTEQALAVAFRTRDLAPVAARATPPVMEQMFGSLLAINTAAVTIGNAKESVTDKQRAIMQLRTVELAADAWLYRLRRLIGRDFKADMQDPVLAVFGTAFTLGIGPIRSYVKGGTFSTTLRGFIMLKDEFCRNVAMLPDCPEKNQALELATAVESGYWLERAIKISNKVATRELKPAKLQLASPFVEKAAAIAGLPVGTANRLKEEVMAGKFNQLAIYNKLENRWNGTVKENVRHNDGIKQSLQSRFAP